MGEIGDGDGDGNCVSADGEVGDGGGDGDGDGNCVSAEADGEIGCGEEIDGDGNCVSADLEGVHGPLEMEFQIYKIAEYQKLSEDDAAIITAEDGRIFAATNSKSGAMLHFLDLMPWHHLALPLAGDSFRSALVGAPGEIKQDCSQ